MIFRLVVPIIFFFALISNSVLAQEENCDEDVSAKAVKLYEKGSNKKKYDKYDRLRYLKEALEEEPDYVAANFTLAIERIKTAKYEGTSFKPAEDNLLAVERLCPNYHSDLYYYLAEIFLGRKDYALAVKYQKKFLNFLSDDENKFARDYPKKVEEVEKDFKYASFYADVFANPVPFDPIVVNDVSTKADEYLPLLTPDNKYLYFTRKSVVEEKVPTSFIKSDKPIYLEQFTVANRLGNSFDEGVPMDEPFNMYKNENYGGATISIDNKELFLTICRYVGGGYKNCDIYATNYYFDQDYQAWRWTQPVSIGDHINNDKSWESQPSLSGDGKYLYFSTYREGSAQIDIYRSTRDANGNWSSPEPLPEPINSAFHDKAPFMHSDSRTLYFASDRPMGFGGYDIYYTKMMDDGSWTPPKNIGYPINTEEDEHGFMVSTDGQKAFFASDKYGDKFNGLDIYSFPLYKGARPQKVAFLGGEVKDEKGEPVKNGKIEIKNLKNKEVQEIIVDSMDGRYAAIVSLEEGDDFIVNLKGEGVAFESKLVSFSDTTEEELYQEITMEQKELAIGEAYNLEDMMYETNSAEIKPESKLMLAEFAEYLQRNPTIKLAIHGHTDNVGKPDVNLALSTDRAYSVTAYLQSQGVDKSRLKFKGFGETRPLASNDTEEGRAINRRTEFVVLSK